MSEQPRALEELNCEELLKELARLASERDHVHAQVGTPDQALPQQAPQVDHLLKQAERMDHIGELLKAKGCQ